MTPSPASGVRSFRKIQQTCTEFTEAPYGKLAHPDPSLCLRRDGRMAARQTC